jgi:hypothetical protein
MTDDITATFTTEEFRLLKEGLESLRFYGGEQVREQAWEIILEISALLRNF